MFSLRFRLVGFKPPSTNDAYVPTATPSKRIGSRPHAFLRKSDVLREWQKFVSRAFESGSMISDDDKYNLQSYVVNMNKGLEVYIKVSMPKDCYFTTEDSDNLRANDASNFIKPIEDAIYSNLGFDDRRSIKITSEKGYNEDGEWYVEVLMTEMDLNNRIDIDLKGDYYSE